MADEVILLRAPRSLKQDAQRLAQREGRSLSAQIRWLLEREIRESNSRVSLTV